MQWRGESPGRAHGNPGATSSCSGATDWSLGAAATPGVTGYCEIGRGHRDSGDTYRGLSAAYSESGAAASESGAAASYTGATASYSVATLADRA